MHLNVLGSYEVCPMTYEVCPMTGYDGFVFFFAIKFYNTVVCIHSTRWWSLNWELASVFEYFVIDSFLFSCRFMLTDNTIFYSSKSFWSRCMKYHVTYYPGIGGGCTAGCLETETKAE